MRSRTPLRVIKLGGSLLSLVDLRERFHAWLQTQDSARNLIVVGGGQAVEAIRELDAIHHFPSNLTHWMCIDLMSSTATLASALLGLKMPISTASELSEFLELPFQALATACIQPTAYYTQTIAIQRKCALPESWDCTSDSIAAWLASSLAADQLVLLKSVDSEFSNECNLPPTAISKLVECGAVDPCFPEASQGLHDIRIVNLRTGT